MDRAIMKHTGKIFNSMLSTVLMAVLLSLVGRNPIWSENLKTQENTLNSVLESVRSDIRKVELKNGIRLLMMKRAYAPTVALYIKFFAGGSDETDETEGIAHMLEHMLFKGTHQVGTRDFEHEKKYLEVSWKWASELDQWRRTLASAEAAGDEVKAKEARAEVEKWTDRLESIQKEARKFMVMDEDSYLYSLNGQRGYNAYTSRDLTNYQIELPANRIEVWARLESDRFRNSVLRDFYTERNVVSEERRMRVDNVSSNLLMERFLKAAYGSHPYGRSLIGSMDRILYLNHEMAAKFYDTYYAPNNMIITVVGDIDFDNVEGIVKKYFGPMEPRRIPRNTPPEVRDRSDVHVELKREGSPFQIMAWFKPSLPDKDDLRMEVLGKILAGSQDSRLFRKLVMEKRIASQVSIYSSYPGERYTNLFLVMGVPAPGRTYDELQDAVLQEIQEIRDHGVTEDELNRVRAGMESDLIYGLRSNSSLADRLSYYETLTGDYNELFDFYEDLPDLKPADIQQAARKYLDATDMMTARLLPPDSPAEGTGSPDSAGEEKSE